MQRKNLGLIVLSICFSLFVWNLLNDLSVTKKQLEQTRKSLHDAKALLNERENIESRTRTTQVNPDTHPTLVIDFPYNVKVKVVKGEPVEV